MIEKEWPKMDYTNLENRVAAMICQDPEKFRDEYFCNFKDESAYIVKRRYDLQPANSGEMVDWKQLIQMVQPITATGLATLNSLRVGQTANTNMYTITRVN